MKYYGIRALLAITALGFVTAAQALTIDYSVAGWGPVTLANNNTPGDTVSLQDYSSLLNLAANTPTVAQINTLVFDVNFTDPAGSFPLNFNRSMTVNLVVGGIVQSGLFDSWYNYYPYDAVVMNPGSTLTFDLGANGMVYVTPLAVELIGTNIDQYTAPVNATFLWTPASVPDGGATLLLLGTALLGLAAFRRKFGAS
jgi:hypothetical protein